MRRIRHLTEWQKRRPAAHAVFFVMLACLTVFAFRVKTSNCLPVKDSPPWCSLAAKMMVDRGAPLQNSGVVTDIDLALLPAVDSEISPELECPSLGLPPTKPVVHQLCATGLRAPPSLL